MKHYKKQTATVTHEPHKTINWPEGHVKVALTDDSKEECIAIIIHGYTHYLHSTTARELEKMLHATLTEYNKRVTQCNAQNGLNIPLV